MATADSLESHFVSMKPAVEFLEVSDQYSYNEDLLCAFKFNDYTPQEGDRIAIFKLGWNFVKDYVVFEWAPVGSREKQHSVIFNRHILPKNNVEIYQICYISGENELHGASSPFQFSVDGSSKMTQSLVANATENLNRTSELSTKVQNEITRLREENDMLRETLKALVAKSRSDCSKNYDEEITELKEVTDSLKTSLNSQQQEINMLKIKIKDAGEEYRKLYLEKVKVEKKLDKLKNKKDDETRLDAIDAVNFDIGGLKSIPPFPFGK